MQYGRQDRHECASDKPQGKETSDELCDGLSRKNEERGRGADTRDIASVGLIERPSKHRASDRRRNGPLVRSSVVNLGLLLTSKPSTNLRRWRLRFYPWVSDGARLNVKSLVLERSRLTSSASPLPSSPELLDKCIGSQIWVVMKTGEQNGWIRHVKTRGSVQCTRKTLSRGPTRPCSQNASS